MAPEPIGLQVRLIAKTEFLPPEGVPWETDADGGEALVEFAGRACYQSWAKPNPRTATNSGYLTHLLAIGHDSVLEHATGDRQDFSTFDGLQGDPVTLVVLLLASWVLAALGEETAFRGYLQVRIAERVGPDRAGAVAVAALGSAVLFALIHLEQGAVGVGATFADALLFSWLARRSPAGLWAAVLAHGFNNTLGLTAVFLVGPIHGLW